MLPTKIFMTDRHRLPNWKEVLSGLPEGTGVILRDYDAPDRKKMAEQIADICAARGLVLSIGGDPELALALGAEVHPIHQGVRILREVVGLGLGSLAPGPGGGLGAGDTATTIASSCTITVSHVPSSSSSSSKPAMISS